VLRSVHAHHPLIESELASVAAAHAEARAARGEFDAVLNAQARVSPLGYYEPRRLDVLLEQPTPILGATVYAGYRLGLGKIAPYYGGQVTMDRGEVRGGMRVPLLQDRSIDGRRARIAASRAQADAAEHDYRQFLLRLELDATVAYQNWIAACRRLAVIERLVELARQRDEQVRTSVALGALPSIEQVDNQRSILERERQLVAARRWVEKASIELSLFMRGPEGTPLVMSREHLPPEPGEPATPRPRADEPELAAVRMRPDLKALDANLEAARVERSLAQNRVAPKLDVFGEVSRDMGDAPEALRPTLEPTVLEVGVLFSMPLWLRSARGKLAAAQAKLRAMEQKRIFAEEKVVAEVRDARSMLQAAHERVGLSRGAADAALQVASGERERFTLGATTVLFVNLREQTAADAQMALIDAEAEVHIAAARMVTAVGESLLPAQ
jgi:outer membrane protein TolC